VRTDTALRRTAAPLALQVCTGPVERARGLLGRSEPRLGTALWIRPCRAVHTCGMRYPIDVAFVDDRGLVLDAHEGVRPFRVRVRRDAASVLELRSGECRRLGLRAGERLSLPAPPAPPARPAREPVTRPTLVVALVLAIAMAWMLGGCAATPRQGDAREAVPDDGHRAALPLPDEELALTAGLEYDSRAWPAAEAAYAALVRRQPANGEYWYRLGVIYLHTARPDAAARAFELAAQRGARPGSVQESLAAARLVQAAQALRRARAAAPPIAGATGSSAVESGSLAAATAAVERLLPAQLLAAVPADVAR
jgi:uncharacterized membrane protein (UPF0127 family)